MRSLQFLPEGFDLELAAEEILGIFFGERSQTRVRTLLLEAREFECNLF
jgi:hypothetical protein